MTVKKEDNSVGRELEIDIDKENDIHGRNEKERARDLSVQQKLFIIVLRHNPNV